MGRECAQLGEYDLPMLMFRGWGGFGWTPRGLMNPTLYDICLALPRCGDHWRVEARDGATQIQVVGRSLHDEMVHLAAGRGLRDVLEPAAPWIEGAVRPDDLRHACGAVRKREGPEAAGQDLDIWKDRLAVQACADPSVLAVVEGVVAQLSGREDVQGLCA